MKTKRNRPSTQELITLGMALRADRATMEQRIRGIFSRKSSGIAYISALVLSIAVSVGCFTTACRPVSAEESAVSNLPSVSADPAGEASPEEMEGNASLLRFSGPAAAELNGDTVLVTSADGKKKTFTVVDDGLAEHSQSFAGLDVVTPQQAAREAARVAVTLWGDAVEDGEVHVQGRKYAEPDSSLAYYEIGMGGKPWADGCGACGLVDAQTGTLLSFDADEYGKNSKKYGSDVLNGKIRDFVYDPETYGQAQTSEKAMATAVELIETCFPTGKVIPCVSKDAPNWDTVSYTDGEQIAWSGGYMALVDVYLRMDKDPCYYARIGVPLEEGAEPSLEIFSCYPLGWEYCMEGTWDPAQLEMLKREYEEMRAHGGYTVFTEEDLNRVADCAVDMVGQSYHVSEAMYDSEFVEEQGKERIVSMGFVQSLGTADPGSVQWLCLEKPEDVKRCALRGQTLEFPASGLWAVYVGDGKCVYLKAGGDGMDGVITEASVAEMMGTQGCHLQINDYITVSPEVEALLDSVEAQPMPTPTPVPAP